MTREKDFEHLDDIEVDDVFYDERAERLADLFSVHAVEKDGEDLVSMEGLEEMSEYFETIDMEDRADVFMDFLMILQDEGYEPDVNQFLSDVEAEQVH